MPHRRSPSKAVGDGRALLVEGLVCRESNVADRLVNKRWMQLFGPAPGAANTSTLEPPVLASFRHQTDAEPSKLWEITQSCSVTEVEKGTFHLRVDTSTLVAVIAAKFTSVEMCSFLLHFGFSGLFAAESLRLCFETEEQAQEWHSQLAALIRRLERQGSGALNFARTSSSASVDAGAAVAGGGSAGARGSGGGPRQVTVEPGLHAADGSDRTLRTWQSVRHVNGVAVYAEEEGGDGEGGALMVSAVVRSSPQECFEVLMTRSNSAAAILQGEAQVLEVIDKHTQIVMHSFQPGGLVGRLCAPREMCCVRSWRQDQDGTYIILYQSTNHRKARPARGGLLNWRAPVRASVQAAGFTVAPLLPRYTGGGPSQECLVTLVMKIDLGGWLSQRSLLRRLGRPLAEPLMRAWLEPMLLSVVMLRDKVEQSRFVVRPYSMGDAIEEPPETPRVEGPEAAGPRAVNRTTTFLTYSGRRSQDLKDFTRRSLDRLAVAAGGASLDAAAAVAEADGEFQDAMSRRTSVDDAAGEAQAAPGVGQVSIEEVKAVRAALARQQAQEVPEDERWAVQGTAARRYWSCPGNADLRVRGKNYLVDKKKIPAAMPMFDLYSAELVEVDEPMWHMARFLPSVKMLILGERLVGVVSKASVPMWHMACFLPSVKYCAAPFMFILQLMVPANPPISLTMVWTAPLNPMTESLDTLCAAWPEDPQGTVRSFFTNLCEWMKGEGPEADAVRNKKFKLIPRIVKGSWIVKQSVGTTPVLLGQKLTTRYFRGPNYFEVDVDITSNTVANSVTSLVVGAITSLVVDLAPLVEGQAEDELPERLIGSVRFEHLDLKSAAYLDDESGRIYKNEKFKF
ncbi:ENHANCED DISEASE RESISTANCE 2 isoform X2 isoform B [Chlorella sorokiniana]|uniref:ENHANCED DISEASE RESISTANCE 2 isoform X2 isoform B n=1 Tax=Chlorella sorokiniana TaxID=3076 RepID=A0A2P6TLU4_CHLSO|nr:ENHANCED DISEASE RESISTANCE 2 isoform X2 isoform B [Chlorella sorokiniana]|eukprot:PRW45250.1 ENHANCED DISEASE RESISTANCE 2 isoform X2 isoform B [Chlorella sorokiniana]